METYRNNHTTLIQQESIYKMF